MHQKSNKSGGNSLLRDNAKNRVAILAQMEKGEAQRSSNLEESQRVIDLSKSEVSRKSDKQDSLIDEPKKAQENMYKTELKRGQTD